MSSRNIPPGDLIVFGFLEPSWCVFKLKRDSGASLWATPPRSRKFQRASGELQLPGRRQAKPITAIGSCEYAAFEGRMLPGGTSPRTTEPIRPRKVNEPLPKSLNSEADFTYFVDSERVQALRGQKILARRRWNESSGWQGRIQVNGHESQVPKNEFDESQVVGLD